MTDSIFEQMNEFHNKMGVHEVVKNMDKDTMDRFLYFRIQCIREELEEIESAYGDCDPEEVVDGLIDLMVFASGTLDLYGVDGDQAWDEVYEANIQKEPGVKEGRPNPYGLPDLIKPEGWTAPNHNDNLGKIRDLFDE